MMKIYHITHIDNLPNIIFANCLWSDAARIQKGVMITNIGHNHIKQRRLKRSVQFGGCLGNYVPFYFAPRSPMLYVIHNKRVSDYQQGQGNIIHLVSNADLILSSSNLKWCFTDRHAELAHALYFTQKKDLNEIDWELMNSNYWGNTIDYPDKKEKRQAEFLVYNAISWDYIIEIGVYNDVIKKKVESIIKNTNHQPNVSQNQDWYY